MSSLRAVELPTQRLEPLRPAATEVYLRPRRVPRAPRWALRAEEAIRVVARFGYSPTPTIVLVAVLAVAASVRP